VAIDAADSTAWARARGRASTIVALTPGGTPSVEERFEASPLGPVAAVPVITCAPVVGTWIAVAVGLAGDALSSGVPAVTVEGDEVAVTWTDGIRTSAVLTTKN